MTPWRRETARNIVYRERQLGYTCLRMPENDYILLVDPNRKAYRIKP